MTKTAFGKSKLAAVLLALPLAITPLAAGAQQSMVADNQQAADMQLEQERATTASEGRLLSRLILMENRAKIAEVLAMLADQPQHRVEQALRDTGTRATLDQYGVALRKFAVAMEPHWSTVVRSAEADGLLTTFQAQLLLKQIADGYGNDAEALRPQIGPVRDLARMEGRNLANQALAELSGKSLGEVQLLIGELGSKAAAASLGVSSAALQQAVVAKVQARIKAAAADGRIAGGQAASLLEGLQGGVAQISG